MCALFVLFFLFATALDSHPPLSLIVLLRTCNTFFVLQRCR